MCCSLLRLRRPEKTVLLVTIKDHALRRTSSDYTCNPGNNTQTMYSKKLHGILEGATGFLKIRSPFFSRQ